MSMSIAELQRTLAQSRLSGARDTLQTHLEQAAASQMSDERAGAAHAAAARRARSATFPPDRQALQGRTPGRQGTLAEIDWSFNPKVPHPACFELHTLKIISESANALLIGKPGSGKSNLAKAVAYHASAAGAEGRLLGGRQRLRALRTGRCARARSDAAAATGGQPAGAGRSVPGQARLRDGRRVAPDADAPAPSPTRERNR